jgi:HEPN domain-containing protein
VARGLIDDDPPAHDVLCYLCQQSAEKYLKAILNENRLPIPRTHDLERLAKQIGDPDIISLRRGLLFLSTFAVDVRYPDKDATRRQAQSALRWADKVRQRVRKLLKLTV